MTNGGGSNSPTFFRFAVALLFWSLGSLPTTYHLPPTTALSIPLWFSRNKEIVAEVEKELLEVSIPLWFSRNSISPQPAPSFRCAFPYHYGSHATIIRGKEKSVEIRLFPYHYGSHATRMGYGRREVGQWVSIPLWFI